MEQSTDYIYNYLERELRKTGIAATPEIMEKVYAVARLKMSPLLEAVDRNDVSAADIVFITGNGKDGSLLALLTYGDPANYKPFRENGLDVYKVSSVPQPPLTAEEDLDHLILALSWVFEHLPLELRAAFLEDDEAPGGPAFIHTHTASGSGFVLAHMAVGRSPKIHDLPMFWVKKPSAS